MSKAKIVTAKLHEMWIAGVKPSDMAAEFGVSIPGINAAIGHQRLLYPDKWPKRKGGVLEYIDAPQERVPIVATRPPLRPIVTPRNTTVKTYQMTDEDRERIFGKPGDQN